MPHKACRGEKSSIPCSAELSHRLSARPPGLRRPPEGKPRLQQGVAPAGLQRQAVRPLRAVGHGRPPLRCVRRPLDASAGRQVTAAGLLGFVVGGGGELSGAFVARPWRRRCVRVAGPGHGEVWAHFRLIGTVSALVRTPLLLGRQRPHQHADPSVTRRLPRVGASAHRVDSIPAVEVGVAEISWLTRAPRSRTIVHPGWFILDPG